MVALISAGKRSQPVLAVQTALRCRLSISPAAAGEILEVFCSGLGPTDPVIPAGTPAPLLPLARSFIPYVVIGGTEAGVLFAGLSPGRIGLYQINIIVSAGLTPGFQEISIRRLGERPIAGITIV